MRLAVIIAVLHGYVCMEVRNPRTVNLALETILEFDPKDNVADIKFIGNIQDFLDRMKDAITRNQPTTKKSPSGELIKFSDFIKNMIVILDSYNDDDFIDATNVFKDVLKEYYINEIPSLQKEHMSLPKLIHGFEDKTVREIRKILNDTLIIVDGAKHVTKFFDDLFGGLAKKMMRVLEKLALYQDKSKRNRVNLGDIVRNAVRSILDLYNGLDDKTKRSLRTKVKALWANGKSKKTSEESIAGNVKLVNLKATVAVVKPTRTPKLKGRTRKVRNEAKKRYHLVKRPASNVEKSKSYKYLDHSQTTTGDDKDISDKNDDFLTHNKPKSNKRKKTASSKKNWQFEARKQTTKAVRHHSKPRQEKEDKKRKIENKNTHKVIPNRVKKFESENKEMVDQVTSNERVDSATEIVSYTIMGEVETATEIVLSNKSSGKTHQKHKTIQKPKKKILEADVIRQANEQLPIWDPDQDARDISRTNAKKSDVFVRNFRKSKNNNDTFTIKTDDEATSELETIKTSNVNDIKTTHGIVNQTAAVETPTSNKQYLWKGTTKRLDVKKATEVNKLVQSTTGDTKTKSTKHIIETTLGETDHPKYKTKINVFNVSNDVNKAHAKNSRNKDSVKQNPEEKMDEQSHEGRGLDIDNEVFNETSKLKDGLNDLDYEVDDDLIDKYNNTDITSHMANLEKYLEDSKPNPNDKRRVVRQKMLDDLKGILSEKPGENNNKVFSKI